MQRSEPWQTKTPRKRHYGKGKRMEHDPRLNDLTDPLDRGLVIDICPAPGWKPGPFKVALFYTTAEMARILKVDPSTLRRWRRQEPPSGPRAKRLSDRSWRYYHSDFIEWMNEGGQPMDAA